jgi:hypothetical protein
MEANQRNAWRTAKVAFAVGIEWRRPVVLRQFSKVGSRWRRTRGTHGGRRPAKVAFAVGIEWRRTRETHGGRHKYDCKPSCRDGGPRGPGDLRLSTWVLRETRAIWQVSKVGRQRGQPSSGRWRQENAAGEAVERISALSGIGAGIRSCMITYKSMAMAAGEDDADNSSPGGFSPARHRCKTAVMIA